MDPPPSRGSTRDGLSAQRAKASRAFSFVALLLFSRSCHHRESISLRPGDCNIAALVVRHVKRDNANFGRRWGGRHDTKLHRRRRRMSDIASGNIDPRPARVRGLRGIWNTPPQNLGVVVELDISILKHPDATGF